MLYRNMLYQLPCRNCQRRNVCFLQRMPLQNYPEETQNFVIHLPQNIFSYNNTDYRWHAHYRSVEDQIIAYYDAYDCYVPSNRQYPLSNEAQKENDRNFIRERFKHLLDVAAKATEDTDPEASIMFDGIGVILASDYLEAVHKILSMFSKYDKIVKTNETSCPHYSVGF